MYFCRFYGNKYQSFESISDKLNDSTKMYVCTFS